MPRRNWIDKNNAKTFVLVHRAQNDPKIHDEEASSMVFAEKPGPKKRVKTREDSEEELGLDPSAVRGNEGEAADYGIYYDDTEYDYMQHMRDLGSSSEEFFIETSSGPQAPRKGKEKQSLEEALRETRLDDASVLGDGAFGNPPQMVDDSMLPSKSLQQTSYQDQQNVQDSIVGLQPDMDPRLREVLEALDDEAYIDEEGETFAELAKDKEEMSLDEFQTFGDAHDRDRYQSDLDEGWETDDTTKPSKETRSTTQHVKNGDVEMGGVPAAPDSGNWMSEYGKFKADSKKAKAKPTPSNSDMPSSIVTGSSANGGRRKKRKGALTSTTSYSMSSSSIQRTEGLTLLDDRFEQIERLYTQDEEDEDDELQDNDGGASIVSTAMSSRGPVRSDLDAMMDEFLGTYSMTGKKRVRRVGNKRGLEQLDEIRQGLGPARILSNAAAATTATGRAKGASAAAV